MTPRAWRWLALVLLAAPAWADKPRVLLAKSNGPREAGVLRRLEAELRLAGFEPVQREVGGTVARALLDTLAQQEKAFAAVALTEAGRSIDVWIEDRVTGKTLIRTLVADDDGVIATRAAELLQASFVELTLRSTPAPVPPEVRRLVQPRPFADRPWLLTLGVFGGGAPGTGGRLGAAVGVQRAAGWFLTGVRVLGGVLGTVVGEAGSASLTEVSLLADAGARLALTEALLLQASALAGGHFVSGVGSALGFNTARVASAWTAAFGARAEVVWAVDARLGLRGGVEIVVGLRPVRVLLGDVEVAATPAPLVVASAGLVLAL
ncbi:MAG: hypothetical protein INH41_23365 [Myxococcaceae bacterium]|jgi:hypothetical protein|nr:hypothetical protein [Myxococcaceae bacterium]MCA3015338.1 hypothetical protein [Myxococcaceae bacterium]